MGVAAQVIWPLEGQQGTIPDFFLWGVGGGRKGISLNNVGNTQ